jgi:hypothetical protein
VEANRIRGVTPGEWGWHGDGAIRKSLTGG